MTSKKQILINAESMDRLVSENIKKRRKSLGISQGEIAAAIGVSTQQVQKYEVAVNRISSGKLYHIANLLKISVGSFFVR